MSPPGVATTDDTRPLREMLRVAGRACAGCGGHCSKRDAVRSIALGFKAAPRRLPCLSAGLGRDTDDLRAQLDAYVRRNECYRRAWAEAERLDGVAAEDGAGEAGDDGEVA